MGASHTKPPTPERVWVTGASGGLGEEVAAAYAARGSTVIVSARRRSELDRVAARCRESGAVSCEVVPLDQSKPDSVERALREVLKTPLDVVVLCGGVGSRGRALDMSAATLRKLVDTNFLSTAELGRRCAQHFIEEKRHGRVVVVSSVQGFFGIPGRAGYAASKHALHGYFDSLRAELAAEAALQLCELVGAKRRLFRYRCLLQAVLVRGELLVEPLDVEVLFRLGRGRRQAKGLGEHRR